MGSLFSAPKPIRINPPAPPPQPVIPTPTQTIEAVTTETRLRARRGIEGTINTSLRGVLDAAPAGLARKSLLGE